MRIQSVDESQLDPELREKLQVLLQKKQEAVDQEDFDAAIELKEISSNDNVESLIDSGIFSVNYNTDDFTDELAFIIM